MAQSHPSRAQQRWQEHPLMTVLLEELQAIEERRQCAVRFRTLMHQHCHFEIPVQYERLFLRAPARIEGPTHDHHRSTRPRHARRVPHPSGRRHGHRVCGRQQRILRLDTQRQ
jgi:hypothetical protein